jgi:hypothetical protein
MVVTLRNVKGSALTHSELDANFTTITAQTSLILDSAQVTSIASNLDALQPILDSAAVTSIVQANGGIDSAATTALIDATYINNLVSKGINDLTNVDISGIANGQVLKWASGSSTFVPANDSGGGGGSSFDQTLNTTDDVEFNTVTASGISTTVAGTPQISSSSNLTISVGGSATVSKDGSGNGGGFRVASLTTAERNALAAANGEIIYNTTTNTLQTYEAAAWEDVRSSGGGSTETTFTLTSNGSADYVFASDGAFFPTPVNDPVLYLRRGETYVFVNNSGGSHPLQIRLAANSGAYNTGVTNNGANSGNITFVVPMSAPATLYYQCTAHSAMGNTINIV